MNVQDLTAYEEYLPQSMREVVELIGVESTFKLIDRFSGINELYIPERIKSSHPIAEAVGYFNARKLSQNFGKTYINVPRAAAAMRALRNDMIRTEYSQGILSARQLAQKYSLTERWIWEIIGQAVNDKQGELF